MNTIYTFFSNDFSGLIAGLAIFLLGFIAFRRSTTMLPRASFGLLSVVGLVLTIGAITHVVRLAALDKRYPPPGVMVDLGGYDVHVLAEGPRGGPPVVLFGGGHSGGYAFLDLHNALKADFRSILIDRPGTGWSDTGPFPRTTAVEVDEVMAVLESTGESGPFVFAGHSFGGLLAANIARRHPQQTAALVLLDPTPLDVVFYGLDRRGLGSFGKMERNNGLRHVFGFYTSPGGNGDAPFEIVTHLATRAGQRFAGASIYEELSAYGLVDRAWETMVFDGELGELPLFLVAPKNEASITEYTQMVGGEEHAERFEQFLAATRERYMLASGNSTRVVAPEGTGHNFVYERPDWLVETMREIVADVSAGIASRDDEYLRLTTGWPGPYGGVPPVDEATPESVEVAYRRAIEEKRTEVSAIANNRDAPTFENTILALESSGVALDRIVQLLGIFTTTASTPEWREVAAATAPLHPQLMDEIAHNERLFARVEAVYNGLPTSAPDAESRRLVTVTLNNMIRRGAGLGPEDKNRLSEINSRLAELRTQFQRNAMAQEASLVVWVDDAGELDGLPDDQLAIAKSAAESKDRPDAWAITITRPAVWPVLTNVHSRSLREQVWRQWVTRGGNPGENDNRPVMTEILRLRGEKAKLFGYPTFAHYQTAARMVGSPDVAMDMLEKTWSVLLDVTRKDIAELQSIVDAEDGDFQLQPWDRLYYAEKFRRSRFDLDAATVMPYLQLDKIVEAMFWAAGRVYGFSFVQLDDVPVVSPDIRVFEVQRDGEVAGVLWIDLFQRQGKGPASWAAQYRSAESFRGRSLPLVVMHSAAQKPLDGGPVLIPWERANVIFHEFGHTLQTLSNAASYPSLGALTVPWDFIEVPSLLHERWLADREVLSRFAVHHETGEPMPDELIERLFATLNYDRVFSATLNFLGTAIVDMRLHLMADGSDIDAMAAEAAILEELELPAAIDLTLYVPHAFHTFSEYYAAGVYTYLWSDVIAADLAEAFLEAPGGLYDEEVAARYRAEILDVANTVPVTQAFRTFRDRDPDPTALMRRFGLLEEE